MRRRFFRGGDRINLHLGRGRLEESILKVASFDTSPSCSLFDQDYHGFKVGAFSATMSVEPNPLSPAGGYEATPINSVYRVIFRGNHTISALKYDLKVGRMGGKGFERVASRIINTGTCLESVFNSKMMFHEMEKGHRDKRFRLILRDWKNSFEEGMMRQILLRQVRDGTIKLENIKRKNGMYIISGFDQEQELSSIYGPFLFKYDFKA